MAFTDDSCREFVEVLASKAPVPGGGGASALIGAIGTALGNMVGSLTVGKKKYADVEEDIIELKKKADKLQDELLALVAADAEVFEPLSKAYGMNNEFIVKSDRYYCLHFSFIIDFAYPYICNFHIA